jgi:hypothetical protein
VQVFLFKNKSNLFQKLKKKMLLQKKLENRPPGTILAEAAMQASPLQLAPRAEAVCHRGI